MPCVNPQPAYFPRICLNLQYIRNVKACAAPCFPSLPIDNSGKDEHITAKDIHKKQVDTSFIGMQMKGGGSSNNHRKVKRIKMDSDDIRIGVIIGLEESGGEGILVVEDQDAKDIVRVPCDWKRVMVALQQKYGNVISEGWGLVENGGHVGKVIAWHCDVDGELAGFEPVGDWRSGTTRNN